MVRLNQLVESFLKSSPYGAALDNQFGDKVVMAPRIKAALEKFNKKKEEKPEIIHYGGKAYRRKKASIIFKKCRNI